MKLRGVVAGAALGLLAGAARADPLTSGLEGYWQFNGNGSDSSGNGHTLSLSGGATYGAGLFGQALSLDGVQGSSAFLNPSSSSTFDLGSANFTIQVWANLSSLLNKDGGPGVLIEDFTGQSGPGWTLYYQGGGGASPPAGG